jgi:hypothetical protein
MNTTWRFGHYDPRTADKILTEFSSFRMKAGFPHNIALFKRPHNVRHDMITIFFSPGTEELAKLFDAASCEKPSKENLQLFAGYNDESWKLFFPECSSEV